MSENARWASAQIVRNGDRYFVNNDRGDLIIAKLAPEGEQEIDRVKATTPTNPLNRCDELGAIHWAHPAYANRHWIDDYNLQSRCLRERVRPRAFRYRDRRDAPGEPGVNS